MILRPEFFDIFGFIGFAFLFVVGLMMIKKKRLPSWISYIIFIIASLGLIVDGYIVIKTYLLGG